MTERLVDSGSSESEVAASRAAPSGSATGGLEATLLGLQRTAGNTVVARLAREWGPSMLARRAGGVSSSARSHAPSALAAQPRAAPRTLARCGPGGCSCGGTCGDWDDEDVLRAGRTALRRAVAARTPASPAGASEPPARPLDRAQRPRALQRTVRVRNPGTNIANPGGTGVVQTNAATIEAYLQMLCAAGAVTVDASTGAVSLAAGFCQWTPLPSGMQGPPSPSRAHMSSTPAGCDCLCDMIDSAHAWTIVVDDVDWPHTSFADDTAAETPGTGTGGEVTAPSPNSPRLWGTGTISGGTLDIAPWLVLGHELCGHGWLGDKGLHGPDHTPPRGQGGHQETVRQENLIRAEHGIEARGGFKDPNCGESYWRDRAHPGTVHWSSFRNICIQWRRAYNRRHHTSYGISDRIP